MINEHDPIQVLKGIGAKKSELYRQIGIHTIHDLLHYFPTNYQDRGKLSDIKSAQNGTKILTKGLCTAQPINRFVKKNLSLTIVPFSSDEADFRVVFYNQPYRKNQFKTDHEYIIYGVVSIKNGAFSILSPEIVPIERAHELDCGVYPVYSIPRSVKISEKELKKHVASALVLTKINDTIPGWIKQKAAIPPRPQAYQMIHQPNGYDDTEQALRYIRLFDFLLFHLRFHSHAIDNRSNGTVYVNTDLIDVVKEFPFQMTTSQQNALKDIIEDLRSGRRMNRLLQGDVGSGKTAIAICAAYLAAKNGHQCVITAPTEILAKQHFHSYQKILDRFEFRSVVLYSSMGSAQYRKALEQISSGEISVIFGTHAVFSDQVRYCNLSMIVIDEQHRYGVMQRSKLEQKGQSPHLLVMSATPIPRTLALSVYKNLSISVLDELPRGRLPIETTVIQSSQSSLAFEKIRTEIGRGNKAYIVCPAIEESNLANVQEVFQEISQAFSDVRVGCLTGKMKEEEKNLVMQQFTSGKIQILVATTVIEVGVDVSDATVIWIKNSERYGLAQLHQLRGRVGRSDRQSYCILETDYLSETIKRRLNILVDSNDGFRIAQEDLHLRGCGELLGYRQSGQNDNLVYDALQFEELFLKAEQICASLVCSPKPNDQRYLKALMRFIDTEQIIFN